MCKSPLELGFLSKCETTKYGSEDSRPRDSRLCCLGACLGHERSAWSRPTMPGGVHGHMRAWDPEEDRLIIEMLSQHGPRWAKIVKELPGRTISSIRCRWQRIDRGRRISQSGAGSKNHCQWCGQPKRGHVCFARMQPQPSEVKEECEATRSSNPAPQPGPTLCDAPATPLAQRILSEGGEALNATLLSSSDPEEDEDDDDDVPSVPIISRMQSGARICRELGFEPAVDAAAERAAEGDALFTVVPVSRRSVSERSVRSEPELHCPIRVPSLRLLAPALAP